MKDCFICFEPILHGISFGCNHEICTYCFMKLETNLCPYCRFPMYKCKFVHYSSHIPPFLQDICKTKDLFSYVLLQMYYTQWELFHYHRLIHDIHTWTIHEDIKKLYIHDVKILYQYKHPEKKQLLILLFHMLCISFLGRNEIFIVEITQQQYKTSYGSIVVYPVFILCMFMFLMYGLYYIYDYRTFYKFHYKERSKIQIKHILTMTALNELVN